MRCAGSVRSCVCLGKKIIMERLVGWWKVNFEISSNFTPSGGVSAVIMGTRYIMFFGGFTTLLCGFLASIFFLFNGHQLK